MMKNIKFLIILLFAAVVFTGCENPDEVKTIEPTEWLPNETLPGIYGDDQMAIFNFDQTIHQVAFKNGADGSYSNRIQNDDVTVYVSMEFINGCPNSGDEDVKVMVKSSGVEGLSGITSYEMDVIAAKNDLVYLWDYSKNIGIVIGEE